MGRLITSLSTDTFGEALAPPLSVVIFSAESCPPCAELKETLSEVAPDFPSVSFFEFQKDQEDALEIRKKYMVGYPPRVIAFKDGEDVGRWLGVLPPDIVAEKLKELVETGVMLSLANDSEEVSRFYGTVMEVLDYDWRGMSREVKDEKAQYVVDLSQAIIRRRPDWSVLSYKDIKVIASSL